MANGLAVGTRRARTVRLKPDTTGVFGFLCRAASVVSGFSRTSVLRPEICRNFRARYTRAVVIKLPAKPAAGSVFWSLRYVQEGRYDAG